MRLMEASALSSGPAACEPAISPSGLGAAQDVSTWGTCARATLEGFYFYLSSPLLPSLSPAVFSAVLLSPWLEIVSLRMSVASLGTFPFLQLLGNVSPIFIDGLRSFLIEQARVKACASAPISLLPSSALGRRPGSDRFVKLSLGEQSCMVLSRNLVIKHLPEMQPSPELYFSSFGLAGDTTVAKGST
jgi:hypothetical protein